MVEKKIEKNGLTNEELRRLENLLNEANLQQLSAVAMGLSKIITRKIKEEQVKQK